MGCSTTAHDHEARDQVGSSSQSSVRRIFLVLAIHPQLPNEYGDTFLKKSFQRGFVPHHWVAGLPRQNGALKWLVLMQGGYLISSSILGPPVNVQRALGNKGWTVNDVRPTEARVSLTS